MGVHDIPLTNIMSAQSSHPESNQEDVLLSNTMSTMGTLRLSLRRFHWRLYLTLIFRYALPTIYLTVRVFLLGSLPSDSAVNIASQMAWVNILLEVFEEALLQPLYHCFGSEIIIADEVSLKNKVKTGFMVCTVVYIAFSSITAASARVLVQVMGQRKDLECTTVDYIRLQLCGIVAAGLGKYFMLLLVVMEENKHLLVALTIQMLFSVLFDIILVSQLSISWNLGIMGIAISTVATAIIVLAYTLIICWRKVGMKCSDICSKCDFSWFKRWTRVGVFSAADSLIRNVVYLVVVLRAMNLLKEQDSYWITNNFIWSWLLMPVLPLAELLKQDVSSRQTLPHWKFKMTAYLVISLAIIGIWAVTIPAWKSFITTVLKASNPDLVNGLALQLLPCYMFSIINSLFSAVFYARGRTELLTIGTIFVSLLLITLFLMMTFNILAASVKLVAWIFGGGLIAGSLVSGIQFLWLMRRIGNAI